MTPCPPSITRSESRCNAQSNPECRGGRIMSAEHDGALPDGPAARNAFLIENLGINQALLVLELEFPIAYKRISNWHRFIHVDSKNKSWRRGDDGPTFTVVDLLVEA